MSEKLSHALRELEQSVVNLEQNYVQNERRLNAPRPGNGLDQRDLFSLSQSQDNEKITAVLDRTIDKMEKIVGEN